MNERQFLTRFTSELPADPIRENRRRQVHSAAFSFVEPTPVASPRLAAYSPEVLELLELSNEEIESKKWLDALSGNGTLPGFAPYSACYGGHQFGNWAGQLGDGRAITLGELVTPKAGVQELQLKGAGPTPYSRTADGRAVLRSSLREYLCSEAMHHLGIPTTRALSLVLSGDNVVRDMFYDGHPEAEPGAIVCRVAPTFLRFGNYELPSSRGDVALLKKLVAFTIRHHFPAIAPIEADTPDDAVEASVGSFFAEVVTRTAFVVSEWMRVGFVHGVMNTDNMSIVGLTIDYGPYGFLDEYDPAFTPNTTDADGRRYAYARQPEIAYYNLSRLAIALRPLFVEPKPLQEELDRFATRYHEESLHMYGRKFGLSNVSERDEPLLVEAFSLLHEAELDFTLFFQRLVDHRAKARGESGTARFFEAFYRTAHFEPFEARLAHFLETYDARVARDEGAPDALLAGMRDANPVYIFRNYLAQEAIDALTSGNEKPLLELHEALRRPYERRDGLERYEEKRPEWARHKAGCSMLSCSS